MRARPHVRRVLEATLGPNRASQIARAERHYRERLSAMIAPATPTKGHGARAMADSKPAARKTGQRKVKALGEPNDRQGGWIPSDPFVPHTEPTMSRHDLLRGLHEALRPRTYLEIGVNEGSSLTLSRTKTVAVDPDFIIRKALHCDLELVKAKSDEFFGRPDALAHFDDVPVDLAFIDGMHLSEFALRDFINVERHLSPASVTVFDDVLPRNALEAARVRRTGAWAGDVYKAVEIISRRRPDLLVVLINTWPTGTAVVIGADPSSELLTEAYSSEAPYLEAKDPQSPPLEYMSRSAAVDPADLLESEAWPLLVKARLTGDPTLIEKAKDVLRSIPTLG